MANIKKKSLDFVPNRDGLDAYCREIKQYRSLTIREEQALGREIQNGNKRAVKELVQANLKFVVAVCRNYAARGLPFGDLINEGNLGLMRAAQRYDSSMDFKFISYAVWWIRQGILAALAEQTRSFTVSTSRVELIRKLSAASRKLEQSLHRPPSVEELAEATGHGVAIILACRMISASPLSLSWRPNPEGSGDPENSLEDKSSDRPDRAALLHLLGKRVDVMLARLEERERLVVKLYYGIGYEAQSSLEDIGNRLHLTRERIRQIKDLALKKLRKHAQRVAAFASIT